MKQLYTYKTTDLILPDYMSFNDAAPTAEELVMRESVSIGQRKDYSEYLILSEKVLDIFQVFDGNYDNWDFNYCQEWGLTINDEVVGRVKKELKLQELNNITVTTSKGNLFDGRQKDQISMLAAIQASAILNTTSTDWKLHDNTIVTITLDELKEALALSIQAVGNIVKI